jgi:hypothetical protein
MVFFFLKRKRDFAKGKRCRGGEEDPLARYVHPPLVKTEPVDRRQHGNPERIGLESVGDKKTGNEGQYLD